MSLKNPFYITCEECNAKINKINSFSDIFSLKTRGKEIRCHQCGVVYTTYKPIGWFFKLYYILISDIVGTVLILLSFAGIIFNVLNLLHIHHPLITLPIVFIAYCTVELFVTLLLPFHKKRGDGKTTSANSN
jgi:hypothetical protein